MDRTGTSVTTTYSSSSSVKSFHADHKSVATKAALFTAKTKQVKTTTQSQRQEKNKVSVKSSENRWTNLRSAYVLQFREIRHWTSLWDGELLGVNKAKLLTTVNLMPKDKKCEKKSTVSLPSKRRVL